MKTLIVYESVPESCDLYLIPNDVAQPHIDKLVKCHGNYINTDPCAPECDWLSEQIADGGLFATYKVAGPLVNEQISTVIVTGFVL